MATVLGNVATEHLGRPTGYGWNADREGHYFTGGDEEKASLIKTLNQYLERSALVSKVNP